MNKNSIISSCLSVFIILIIFGFASQGVAGSCKGCVELDSITFDKITENFKYSIIKFDVSYPYGPKHEAYEEFAKNIADVRDLIAAEVGVKDYGDKENQDLIDRYGIDFKELPKVLIFKRDNLKNPVKFEEEDGFTADNLRKFIRQNSDLYLGLAGCLKEFDELAMKFIKESSSGDEQKNVINEAEKALEKVKGTKDEAMAKVYVAFMGRIVERGSSFVAAEKQRLKKLLEGKISDAKKTDLKKRLNVLESFTSHEGSNKVKSEL